jgi:outer membrane protein
VRLRGIAVVPTADGNAILPAFPTSILEAQSSIMPEIDITDMVTRNFGIELIAATTPHDFEAQGALAGLGDVAHAWLPPPTLLAQYHFDTGTRFKPYVGAGVNVTFTYGENASASIDAALGRPRSRPTIRSATPRKPASTSISPTTGSSTSTSSTSTSTSS